MVAAMVGLTGEATPLGEGDCVAEGVAFEASGIGYQAGSVSSVGSSVTRVMSLPSAFMT